MNRWRKMAGPAIEILGAAALLIAYARYGEHRRWTGEIGGTLSTRIWPFHLETWPWTNEVTWTPRVWTSVGAALAALGASWLWLRARRQTLALILLLATSYGFHVAVNVQRWGLDDGLERGFQRPSEYWQDAKLVDREFLPRYPNIEGLSLHGETHPPGYALFLAGLQRVGLSSPRRGALVTALFTPLTALLLYGIARRRISEEAARIALPLFLFSCSVSAFTIALMDMMNMACAALSLYGLVVVLDGDRRGTSVPGAILWGAGYALASLCTLTSLVLGLSYALLLVERIRERGWEGMPWRALTLAAASFAAVYGTLMAFGYRPIEVALALNRNFAASVNRKRNYWRGLFGNPVAFPGALGIPLLGLTAHALGTSLRALAARLRARRWPEIDGARTWLAVALAPFWVCLLLGRPRAEVEHIFMFLVPPLIVALAAAAVSWYRRGARWTLWVTGFAMAQSILIEVYLDTGW